MTRPTPKQVGATARSLAALRTKPPGTQDAAAMQCLADMQADLPEEVAYRLLRQATMISLTVPNMGALLATELLAKLGALIETDGRASLTAHMRSQIAARKERANEPEPEQHHDAAGR